MRRNLVRLGWLLFLALIIRVAADYGTRWEFGPRYGMPRSMVAANGKTYPDGTPLNDVDRAWQRFDCEEEIVLVMLILPVCVGGFFVYTRVTWPGLEVATRREFQRLLTLPPHRVREMMVKALPNASQVLPEAEQVLREGIRMLDRARHP